MKNFKKVIAFLLVAAMTLGMGVVASAEGTKNDYLETKAEKQADGTVKIQVLVNADKVLQLNAGTLTIALNDDVVEVGEAAIKEDARNKFSEADGYYKFYNANGGVGNYDEASKSFIVSIAQPGAEAQYPHDIIVGDTNYGSTGNVLLEVYAPLKADAAVGSTVATLSFEDGSITDEMNGTPDADGAKKLALSDLDFVLAEAAVDVTTEATTGKTTEKTTGKTTDKTTGKSDDKTTTKAGEGTAATTKSLTDLANSIVTEADAMNALNQAGLDVAVAAANKLNKNAFASDADYNAFKAALDAAKAVLKNPNATQAEKDAALAALEAAMAKADDAKVVAAVKAALQEAAAKNNSTTGKGGKTGDAAPIAALMIVAIAAFGTAVVVYRKKVNA